MIAVQLVQLAYKSFEVGQWGYGTANNSSLWDTVALAFCSPLPHTPYHPHSSTYFMKAVKFLMEVKMSMMLAIKYDLATGYD